MDIRSNRGRLVMLFACLLALQGVAHAQWKWRDARGQVQYSDLPPPAGTPDRDVLGKPRAAPGARPAAAPAAASAPAAAPVPAAAASRAEDPALAARRKQIEQAAADQRKAEEQRIAQTRQQSCERARNHLRTLDTDQRLIRTNAQGEREFVDDAARARESAQARQVIAAECR